MSWIQRNKHIESKRMKEQKEYRNEQGNYYSDFFFSSFISFCTHITLIIRRFSNKTFLRNRVQISNGPNPARLKWWTVTEMNQQPWPNDITMYKRAYCKINAIEFIDSCFFSFTFFLFLLASFYSLYSFYQSEYIVYA